MILDRAAPPLTHAEERELARRAREGDARAAERLVLSCMPFVLAAARRYSRYGASLNDLVQEGLLGLLQALPRFNPDREARLASYASWWVRAAMQEHVIRSWSVVRIGTTAAQRALFFRLRRLAPELGNDEPNGPMEERLRDLAGRFNLAMPDLLALLRRILGRDRGLDQAAPIGLSARFRALMADALPSPEVDLAEASEQRRWRVLLAQALAALPARERAIIARRHLGERRPSFAAIGRELQLSKERVRQLEAEALAKLRSALGGRPAWNAAD